MFESIYQISSQCESDQIHSLGSTLLLSPYLIDRITLRCQTL